MTETLYFQAVFQTRSQLKLFISLSAKAAAAAAIGKRLNEGQPKSRSCNWPDNLRSGLMSFLSLHSFRLCPQHYLSLGLLQVSSCLVFLHIFNSVGAQYT